MSKQPRHEMQLKTEYTSGTELWYCPTCGRQMTITWQPWKKIVLEPGDIYAAHGGSKGILKIGPLQIDFEDEVAPASTAETSAEDPYLVPWARWLKKMESDDFWGKED